MTNRALFWIFGILQHLMLGIIIFLIFQSLSTINGEAVVGLDTQLLVSIGFPLFAFLSKSILFSRRM